MRTASLLATLGLALVAGLAACGDDSKPADTGALESPALAKPPTDATRVPDSLRPPR